MKKKAIKYYSLSCKKKWEKIEEKIIKEGYTFIEKSITKNNNKNYIVARGNIPICLVACIHDFDKNFKERLTKKKIFSFEYSKNENYFGSDIVVLKAIKKFFPFFRPTLVFIPPFSSKKPFSFSNPFELPGFIKEGLIVFFPNHDYEHFLSLDNPDDIYKKSLLNCLFGGYRLQKTGIRTDKGTDSILKSYVFLFCPITLSSCIEKHHQILSIKSLKETANELIRVLDFFKNWI